MAENPAQRRLAAILAADVVGYSRLMEANEERTMAALKHHRREFFDPTTEKHGGRIFKVMGDGFLVEFGSVLNAARCAVEIQRGMPIRNEGVPEDRHIKFRIGLNVGDLIVDGDDFYGDGVNMAARLEALASPGGISCSEAVRTQIGNKLDMEFLDQGEITVKNIAQPVHVYFINMAEVAPYGAAQATAFPGKPSVAVLPFSNMSNDPEQEYFSDGITEDIITDLSKVSGLSVLSRNTVFTLKGKALNLQQAARQLGVAYVVEGSVRKAGNRVRITAQLIEGATDRHLWADRYDRELTDIFALQDEITRTIVAQLKVTLLPEEREAIVQPQTENVEAYTLYLKGRDFFRRSTKPNLQLARQMFSRAIELDPLYARAFAGLADCDSMLFLQYSEGVSIDDILTNCAKALSIDPRLAEARASRGLALSLIQRYAEAEAELELAIASNPNLFEAYYFYARLCFTQGKLQEAARHYERAAEVNLDDYQSPSLVAQVYHGLALPEKERDAARRAVERATREIARNPDNPRPLYLGANSLAVLGQIGQAKDWAARALALDPDDTLTKYNIACLYCVFGDLDAALDLLIGLLPQANRETMAWVLYDTDFDLLHADPRWQTVVEMTR